VSQKLKSQVNFQLSSVADVHVFWQGVGAGLDPPKYLVPGTVMEVALTKIGTLRNEVEFQK